MLIAAVAYLGGDRLYPALLSAGFPCCRWVVHQSQRRQFSSNLRRFPLESSVEKSTCYKLLQRCSKETKKQLATRSDHYAFTREAFLAFCDIHNYRLVAVYIKCHRHTNTIADSVSCLHQPNKCLAFYSHLMQDQPDQTVC